MWIVSTLDSFRRLVSWASTILLFAALGNVALAALFNDYWLFRVLMAAGVLLLALVAKRALRTFKSHPQSAVEKIEKTFHALFGICLVGSVYVAVNERALLCLPGVMLVTLNVAVAAVGFSIGQKNISVAKSLAKTIDQS
jgi:hypothetical protein